MTPLDFISQSFLLFMSKGVVHQKAHAVSVSATKQRALCCWYSELQFWQCRAALDFWTLFSTYRHFAPNCRYVKPPSLQFISGWLILWKPWRTASLTRVSRAFSWCCRLTICQLYVTSLLPAHGGKWLHLSSALSSASGDVWPLWDHKDDRDPAEQEKDQGGPLRY